MGDDDWERFNQRQDRIATAKSELRQTRLRRVDAGYLAAVEMVGADLGDSFSLEELAKRPGVGIEIIERLLPLDTRACISTCELEAALADNLYAGYIRAQGDVAQRLKHHDSIRIPAGMDFSALNGLSHEMVERLERTRPRTFGEARAIPGLTAAALSTLYIAANLQA